jgi:hypothetical protein
VPVGAVTTMVPVGVVQIGCIVTVAVGVTGAAGIAFTSKLTEDETHFVLVSLAVTLYVVLGVKPENIPLD